MAGPGRRHAAGAKGIPGIPPGLENRPLNPLSWGFCAPLRSKNVSVNLVGAVPARFGYYHAAMTGSVLNLRRYSSLFALLLVASCASVDTVTGEGDGLGSGNASSSTGGTASGPSGGSSTGGSVASGGAGATEDGGTAGTGGTPATGGTGGTGGTGSDFVCTTTQFFGTNLPAECDPCVIEKCCEVVEACFGEPACSELNNCEAAAGQACLAEAGASQAVYDQCLADACPETWTAERQARVDAAYDCIRGSCNTECYP